jgi:DNA-binding CsgD family transcriptional regulator
MTLDPVLTITPLERAALQLLANGKPCDELANCDLRTLFEKMGAASQAEAVEAACRRGLVDADDVTHQASQPRRSTPTC